MNQTPNPDQYPQSPQPPQPRPIQVAVPNVKPNVTYAIIGFTVFIYLLQLAGVYLLPVSLANSLLAPFGLSTAIFGTTDVAAILGEKVNDLIRFGQIWRLITPVFLHDSSLPYGTVLRALPFRFRTKSQSNMAYHLFNIAVCQAGGAMLCKECNFFA